MYQAKAVAVLIASGADVGLRARKKPLYKCTALYLAAQNGHADAVALLLEAGAEVDERLYKYVWDTMCCPHPDPHTERVHLWQQIPRDTVGCGC